jgi:phosphoribosylaminoimidazole-succinocarboxamide synthase
MKQLQFPQQTKFYRGKVRDVYTISDKWLVMIASDRISAFDVILPRPIPYKGQVLNYFPTPIITPSTKAEVGHDEDISREEIIRRGIVNEADYAQLEKYTLALFARGRELAAKRGLILVDTKYEFGKIADTIYLMDEIHTPDSSRYFYAKGFEQRQAKGEKQQQLSKEFVREWLIANNFMGKEGQSVPIMSDEWVETISKRYIELYEQVIGEPFHPQSLSDEETYQRALYALNNLEG